jgi:uncharacterized membrane protein YbhN (UPF0104 family)
MFRKNLSFFTKLSLIIITLILINHQLNFKNTLDTLEINYLRLIYGFILSSIALLLTSLRLDLLLKNHCNNKYLWYGIHRANIDSQFYSLILPSVIGIHLTRVALLGKYIKNKQLIPSLSIAEKVIALISLMLILLFVNGQVAIELLNPMAPQLIGLTAIWLPTAFIISLMFFKRQLLRVYYIGVKQFLKEIGFLKQLLASITIHFTAFLSFYFITTAFISDISFSSLMPALFLIMTISSLPISIMGFGLREAASAFVFSYFFADPKIGVIVGFIFGLTNIAALIAIKVIALPEKKINSLSTWINKPVARPADTGLVISVKHIVSFLSIPLIILLGTSFSFDNGNLSIRLSFSDPFAIAIFLSLISLVFSLKNTLSRSINIIDRKLELAIVFGLASFGILVLSGYLVGLYTFGSNVWAYTNRLLGLFLLYSYLISGILISRLTHNKIQQNALLSLLASNLVLLAIYLVDQQFFGSTIAEIFHWQISAFSGLATNRNSLAFLLLIVLTSTDFFSQYNIVTRLCVLALTAVLIFATGSKTGVFLITIIFIPAFVYIYMQKPRNFKLSRYQVLALFLVILSFISFASFLYLSSLGEHLIDYTFRFLSAFTYRMNEYNIATTSIKEVPFFGNGLGYYLHITEELTGSPRVMHNTYLWIFIETGLIGSALFAIFGLTIFWLISNSPHSKNLGVMCFFFTILGFFFLHDMSYQRGLWLTLGLLIGNSKFFHLTNFHRRQGN